MASSISNIANNLLTRRCRVIVCGVGGRMGNIRTELIYANPRFELCGVCDINLEAAQIQADKFSVRLLDVSSLKLLHLNTHTLREEMYGTLNIITFVVVYYYYLPYSKFLYVDTSFWGLIKCIESI
ncbi:MAG: hypothetical protein ACI90V_013662 [Bacillariaceae sp.]|jgi:hypothetical protein